MIVNRETLKLGEMVIFGAVPSTKIQQKKSNGLFHLELANTLTEDRPKAHILVLHLLNIMGDFRCSHKRWTTNSNF